MTKFLHGKVSANGWFEVDQPPRPLGVLVRQAGSSYITEPRDLSPLLVRAVEALGLDVAVSISTETTEAIFDVISDNDHDLDLGDGLQLQIVDSMSDIVRNGPSQIAVSQHAALLRNERVLLAWHDDVDKVLEQATKVEEKLLGLVSFTRTRRLLSASKSLTSC
jgi:hypothetical protein